MAHTGKKIIAASLLFFATMHAQSPREQLASLKMHAQEIEQEINAFNLEHLKIKMIYFKLCATSKVAPCSNQALAAADGKIREKEEELKLHLSEIIQQEAKLIAQLDKETANGYYMQMCQEKLGQLELLNTALEEEVADIYRRELFNRKREIAEERNEILEQKLSEQQQKETELQKKFQETEQAQEQKLSAAQKREAALQQRLVELQQTAKANCSGLPTEPGKPENQDSSWFSWMIGLFGGKNAQGPLDANNQNSK